MSGRLRRPLAFAVSGALVSMSAPLFAQDRGAVAPANAQPRMHSGVAKLRVG